MGCAESLLPGALVVAPKDGSSVFDDEGTIETCIAAESTHLFRSFAGAGDHLNADLFQPDQRWLSSAPVVVVIQQGAVQVGDHPNLSGVRSCVIQHG